MKPHPHSTRVFCASLVTVLLTLLSTLHPQLTAAPLGTAFTYQGRLNSGGSAASGYHDFQFKLFDALASGVQQGGTVVSNAVTVSNGLFTVTLDFGPGVFDGSARWLDIGVRTNGAGAFTSLSPRQLLTPLPYALYAPSAGAAATAATAASAQGVSANAVTSAGIASGQVVKSLNGLKDLVALAAGPNVTLATNANTLTISAAGGGASGGWTTTGNAGTTPAANFVGTTDGQPLVLKATRVGVNTNNPQATLHVNGTALATQFAGDGSGLTNVPAALATPFTLTTLATTNFYGHARGLAISGHYAYVASGYASLHVYDISDPAHPIHLGPDTSVIWDATAVALSGHYAFVAGDTLRSVDVSLPASPVIVGSVPGNRTCYGVAVSGNVAYLAADADGLFTYNIANPTAPVSLGHIDNGGNAQGVAVAGNFAYLANDLDGLRIYHVANPAAPVNIASRNEGGHARGIAVSGDFAYLANDIEGLRIYNISNPTNPVSVGHVLDAGYAYGVAISGRYAYVANNNLGLRIYDVSDPANPASVGVAPISGDGVALAVAVVGHYAYTANESGGLATYFAAPLATVPGVIGATAFMGDGASLTNLNAGQLTGQLAPSVASGLWQVTGNAGTTPGRSFLGTTDEQPLEFKVNGQRALRLEPNAVSPNVIGGYAGNVVSNGFYGATIGGGGSPDYPNRVGASYATVVGGVGNTASGVWSTAMGYSTTASGDFSTALGLYTGASGLRSTAMGWGATASGDYSTAMGTGTTASGEGSTAMGNFTTASGMDSFAAGSNTVASGWASFAMGINAQATNTGAVALGQNTIAGGTGSTAMGNAALAIGDWSTAIGYLAYATNGSTAMGVWVDASGDHSIAMGNLIEASGRNSTAIGSFNKATGDYSTALGRFTRASGTGSFAAGSNTVASGEASFAVGADTIASGTHSTAMGLGTRASVFGSTAMGGFSSAIGPYSTAMGLLSTASGSVSTAIGSVTEAAGVHSFALGYRSKALHRGTLVWADDEDADFVSTGNNQFLIRAAGGVGINKNNPATALDVNGTVTVSGDLHLDGWFYRRFSGALLRLDIGPDYNAFWNPNNPSDQRLKRDIETIPAALDSLKQLRGVTFHWNNTGLDRLTRDIETKWKSASGRPEDDQRLWAEKRQEEHERLARRQTGFIAQELERVFPDWVTTDEQGFKQINTKGLDAVLVNAVNEQQVQLETQQAKNAALEKEVAELKALVESLAEKVNGGAR